jgi:hypothetical protein
MQVNSRFVLTSCLTVIALAAAGCGTLDRTADDSGLPLYVPDSPSSAAPVRAVSPSEQAGGAVPEAPRILRSMSLTTKDVKGLDLVARPPDDPTSLAEPTLAGCGASFPSESHRTARYAVTGWEEDGRTGPTSSADVVDSEIVTYDSEKSARRALEEWRAAVDGCRLDDEKELLAVRPGLSFGDLSRESDRSLPIRDNVVTTLEIVEAGKGPFADHVTVHQRHGNLLAVLEYEESTDLTAAQVAKLRKLADVLGRRILAKAG